MPMLSLPVPAAGPPRFETRAEQYRSLRDAQLEAIIQTKGRECAVNMGVNEDNPVVVEFLGRQVLALLLGSGYARTLEECEARFRGDVGPEPGIWGDLC